MKIETKISANENTAATVIEVKTFDSGRFTVKLNGKKIALKVLEQPPYYDSASSDTEIIFNGRKFRNVGHIRVVTDYCNVFADENGYGFFVSGISGDVWSLGKGMTPIRDMSNEIAQIAEKRKAYIDRQNATKAESEITTKLNKNGQPLFYVDGKRVSRLDANIDEGKRIDAITAEIVDNTTDRDNAKVNLIFTLNGGVTGTIFPARLYFTSFENAIDAGKKIAAHFGEKFIAAYINDNSGKQLATVFGGDTTPFIYEENLAEYQAAAKAAALDFSDEADMFTPDLEPELTQSRLVPDNNVTFEEPDFSEWDAELETE